MSNGLGLSYAKRLENCIHCIFIFTFFLSLRFFGLLSSSLLLFPQCFGWCVLRPKCCRNNNKDEDSSPKNLNDKNHQASSQKFRQQTPEEDRRTYRQKRCGNNNKDEDSSPKNLNDKNHQASSQKFRQLTPEEGRRIYWPKRCGNNNKDEDSSPKTLNDENHQASSQKFRQLTFFCVVVS